MSKTQENIKKTIEKVIEDFSKTLNNLSGNLQKSVSEIEETNNITEVKTLKKYIYNFISVSSYVDSSYY
jgi:predicted nuclease of restriction endonuclease-like RecB superfamily